MRLTFPRTLQDLALWGVALFTTLLLLLNSNVQLSTRLFTNDFNAWLLPAVAPLNGWGMPYRDYWAIEPPAVLLMTTIWGIFGHSLAWFHVLSLLLQIGTCWLYWKIVRKVFPFWESVLLYGLGILLYLTPTVQSMFLPSELNGLFFVMAGLYLLLRPDKLSRQAFWASLAFGLAGQMKEVFAFSLLAMIPLFMRASLVSWRQLVKVILATAAGLLVMLAINVGYLVVTDSVGAYREVMVSKSSAFKITDLEFQFNHAYQAMQFPVNRFVLANYSLLVVAAVATGFGWLGLVFSKKGELAKKNKKNFMFTIKLPPNVYGYAVLACYWLGSWLGYIAQNRYGNKYDMAVVFSNQLLTALLVLMMVSGLLAIGKSVLKLPKFITSNPATTLLFGLLFAILSFPGKVYVTTPYFQLREFHPSAYLHKWRTLESPELLTLETALNQRVASTDCVQGVYGWAIGSLHLYSERVPCTRFFIPNIVTKDQVPEYQRALITRPPAALRYASGGADLNISVFEEDIFPYSEVMTNCYQADDKIDDLYWPLPALNSKEKLSQCIEETVTLHNQFDAPPPN